MLWAHARQLQENVGKSGFQCGINAAWIWHYWDIEVVFEGFRGFHIATEESEDCSVEITQQEDNETIG